VDFKDLSPLKILDCCINRWFNIKALWKGKQNKYNDLRCFKEMNRHTTYSYAQSIETFHIETNR